MQDCNPDLPQAGEYGQNMLVSPGPVLEEMLAEGDQGERSWKPLICSIICTDLAFPLQPIHLSRVSPFMTIGVGKTSLQKLVEELLGIV